MCNSFKVIVKIVIVESGQSRGTEGCMKRWSEVSVFSRGLFLQNAYGNKCEADSKIP